MSSRSGHKSVTMSTEVGQPFQKRKSKMRSCPLVLMVIFGTSLIWVSVDLVVLLRFVQKTDRAGFGPHLLDKKNIRVLRSNLNSLKYQDDKLLDTLNRRPGEKGLGDLSIDVAGLDKADALEYIKQAQARKKLEGRIKELGKWIGEEKKTSRSAESDILKGKEQEKYILGKREKDGDDHYKSLKERLEQSERYEEKDRGKDTHHNGADETERGSEKGKKEKVVHVKGGHRVVYIDDQGNEVSDDVTEKKAFIEKEPLSDEEVRVYEAKREAALKARQDAAWKDKMQDIEKMIQVNKGGDHDDTDFDKALKEKKEEEKLAKQKAQELEEQQQQELEIKMQGQIRKKLEAEKKKQQLIDEKAKRLNGKNITEYYHVHGVVPVPYEPYYKPDLRPIEKVAQRGKLILKKVIDYDVKTFRPDPNGPGERGSAYNPKKEKLLVEEGWKEAQFNQYASDKISVERSVPDVRYKEVPVAVRSEWR